MHIIAKWQVVTDDGLACPEQSVLSGCWPGHLNDDVGAAVDLGRRRDDARSAVAVGTRVMPEMVHVSPA